MNELQLQSKHAENKPDQGADEKRRRQDPQRRKDKHRPALNSQLIKVRVHRSGEEQKSEHHVEQQFIELNLIQQVSGKFDCER